MAMSSPDVEGGEGGISHWEDARDNPARFDIGEELAQLLIAGMHGVDHAIAVELREKTDGMNG